MDYIAVGGAFEQKQNELEFGNLQTASTAQLLLLDLRNGKVILNETFTQGYFEIVAPERIGRKFAGAVKEKFSDIEDEYKRMEKKKRRRK